MTANKRLLMVADILIVCTGNICRSPIAEYLLRAALLRREASVQVHSAGTNALVGQPADPLALAILAECDIDATAHRARQVSPAMLAHAGLILTMEPCHTNRLLQQVPEIRGKTFLVGHWRDQEPIPDPYRRPRDAFVGTCELLERNISEWLSRLY